MKSVPPRGSGWDLTLRSFRVGHRPPAQPVRLEVGTAHRRNVVENSHVDNHRLIIDQHSFIHAAAPVGGAHL